MVASHLSVPTLEAHLRAYIEASDLPNALACYENLLRRRRTPQQATCTALLALCAASSPRDALYVAETMAEERGLDLDEYTKICRTFVQRCSDGERLARFQEVALDMLTFSDDAMHNYFYHLAQLLGIELQEALHARGGASEAAEISLITHKRQLDAAALLCKRGTMVTPLMGPLLASMGGREGAQDKAELVRMATTPTGLAAEDALVNARALLSQATLNDSQRAAVDAALTRRLTLVQGPPGTGKTTVAVQILTLWVRALGVKPVLATADSNVAVDNILASLAKDGVGVVRVGRPDAVRPDLHKYLLDNLGGPPALADADVVLCTCVAAGGELLKKVPFQMVLIDETAQSTEPSCLVPLTRGCRQLVLVGDHKQLRPTVLSDEAARRGLKVSLFERMLRLGVQPLLLDTQYRMHPSLATFVSTCFYRGKYLSGVADAKRPQPRGLRWPSPSCNAALLVSGSGEEGAGQSKRNPGEASAVVSLLRDVLHAGELRPAELGVVTPYGAQVGLLRQQVSSLPGGREIEVKSVDGFQGREKELIVFSAVRSNRSGSLGFVADARRLNVMLTRAKRGLVIVGDPTTLVRSRHWADWLEWVEGQRAVLGNPAWRMPARPRSAGDRSPSSDIDEEGRRFQWGADESGSEEEGRTWKSAEQLSHVAARRERRRRNKSASGGGGDGGDGDAAEAWKAELRAAQRELEEAARDAEDGVFPPPPEEAGEDYLAGVSISISSMAANGGGEANGGMANGAAIGSGAAAAEATAGLAESAADAERAREEGRRIRQRLAAEPTAEPAAPQSEAAAGLLPSGPERRGGEEAPLLPNWREVREGEGADARVYYHCSLTGESCLERPSL